MNWDLPCTGHETSDTFKHAHYEACSVGKQDAGSIGSRILPPGPVKISHKEDDCLDFMFLGPSHTWLLDPLLAGILLE